MKIEELNEKMKTELRPDSDLPTPDLPSWEDDGGHYREVPDEPEEEDDDLVTKGNIGSNTRIFVDNEVKIRGIIQNMDFEFKYSDFVKQVHEKIPGVILTREKAHKMIDVFREMMGF